MNSPFFPRRIVRAALALFLVLTVAVIPVMGERDKQNGNPTPGCRNLTASIKSVVAGSSGNVLFTCSHGSVALTLGKAVHANPRFHLPTGYATLTLVPHVSGATSCTPGQKLSSGKSFSFSSHGSFDYCATFSNAPSSGLAAFNVDWQVAQGHHHEHEHEHEDEGDD